MNDNGASFRLEFTKGFAKCSIALAAIWILQSVLQISADKLIAMELSSRALVFIWTTLLVVFFLIYIRVVKKVFY